MKGSVFKRGKGWVATIDLGDQPAQRCDPCGRDGVFWIGKAPLEVCPRCGGSLRNIEQRKRDWRAGFPTKRAAQDWTTDALGGIREGTYVANSDRTVGEYLEEWLGAIKGTVRPTTWASYAMNVRKLIVPALGSIRLQALTAPRLNAFYADFQASGGRRGRALSPRTVQLAHATVRKALKDAVNWSYLPQNVADRANPPRPRKSEMKTWTSAELRTFLEGVVGDRLHAAYFVTATTGLRRGEVLGARWRDCDLDAGWLKVRQTLLNVNYQPTFGEPKTEKGRRSVALDPHTVAVLREHRKRQLEERLLIGPGYRDLDLIFSNPDGSPVHPDRFSDHFEQLVKASGLPRIRLHDLRHSWATMALEMGIHPKVVQEQLGHSTIAITLDIYSHSVPALQKTASSEVAGLIFGS